MLSETAFDWTN